jgi:hypothetical protein
MAFPQIRNLNTVINNITTSYKGYGFTFDTHHIWQLEAITTKDYDLLANDWTFYIKFKTKVVYVKLRICTINIKDLALVESFLRARIEELCPEKLTPMDKELYL